VNVVRPAVGQLLVDRSQVEAKPSLRAAQANRPELIGMGVDPIALDPESVGDRSGIDQSCSRSLGRPTEQLDHPLGDRLDHL
jgi:hypothetical protein